MYKNIFQEGGGDFNSNILWETLYIIYMDIFIVLQIELHFFSFFGRGQ